MENNLPNGWVIISLEKVVGIYDRQRIPLNATERSIRQGPFPYYGANGQVDSIDDFIYDGEYVLLAEDGGFFDQPGRGVAYTVKGKFWVNNHAHVLGTLGSMPTGFLVNYLNSIDWMPYVSGTTRLKLNQGSLKKVPLKIPPLNEQKCIAEKIETLQAKSKKAKKALETAKPLLDKLRQSILASAFRGDLTADWRKKNPDVEPASVLLERIRVERRKKWEENELAKMRTKGKEPKNDKWKSKYIEPVSVDVKGLPELPDGWCWCSLEEICEIVTDGTHQPPKFEDSGIPFIVIRNIIKGQIDWDSVGKWVSEETFKKNSIRFRPERGDILYTAVGSYGVAVEVEVEKDFMFQRHIAYIKPIRKGIFSTYLTNVMNSPYVLSQAHNVARGVAQKTVTLTFLRSFALSLAPSSEQGEITKKIQLGINTIETIQNNVLASSVKLAKIDQSILSKAFCGELVPQDPSDESASKLLEIIKSEKANSKSWKKTAGKKKTV